MPKAKNSKFQYKRNGENKKMQESPEFIEAVHFQTTQSSPNEAMLPYANNENGDDRRSNSDLGNETTKIVEMFAADMNKAFNAKKRDIETFTENVVKINHAYMNKIWNSHQGSKELLIEDLGSKFSAVFDEMESELVRQKEQEEKLQKIYQYQIKLMERKRSSYLQKFGYIKETYDTFVKDIEKQKAIHAEQVDSAMEEMKQEILLLQKRKLMEIQQQEMKNMRRSLHSLFYA